MYRTFLSSQISEIKKGKKFAYSVKVTYQTPYGLREESTETELSTDKALVYYEALELQKQFMRGN